MNFDWIKNFFNKALRIASALIKSVFTSAFKILLAKLQDVATESITKLASTDLSNDEKRGIAFKEIKAYAISKALSFNDRDISLILETIYSSLKNEGVIK